MFIDEKKAARPLDLLRSPLAIALLALTGCLIMMLALIEAPLGAIAAPVSLPSAPQLAGTAVYLTADPRLEFAAVVAGFAIMAAGGFALSRRSLRDALKAEDKRAGRH